MVHRRNHNRPEKWADRNFIQFNKWKCKDLHLGRNSPMHLCTPENDWSFAEKDMEVLLDSKLNISQ